MIARRRRSEYGVLKRQNYSLSLLVGRNCTDWEGDSSGEQGTGTGREMNDLGFVH